MKHIIYFLLGIDLLGCRAPLSKTNQISVGFYNVENLFDTEDEPYKFNEQYLPTSEIKWTEERYNQKLTNLAEVISQLANNQAPHFLGVCEIENARVLNDLIGTQKLQAINYDIVHYESPDERGIDVGFIYNRDVFKVKRSESVEVDLSDFDDATRDILWVQGKLHDVTELHFLINHWSSRREGRKESEPKRIKAAETVNTIKTKILKKDNDANIIVMGDFNDEPRNYAIAEILDVEEKESDTDLDELFNPMVKLEDADLGSYRYRSYWDMLDQIMLSGNLVSGNASLQYVKNSVDIKDDEWLRQHGNKYEGFPLRTYGGRKYLGGYSDHFPVYLLLEHRN